MKLLEPLGVLEKIFTYGGAMGRGTSGYQIFSHLLKGINVRVAFSRSLR